MYSPIRIFRVQHWMILRCLWHQRFWLPLGDQLVLLLLGQLLRQLLLLTLLSIAHDNVDENSDEKSLEVVMEREIRQK